MTDAEVCGGRASRRPAVLYVAAFSALAILFAGAFLLAAPKVAQAKPEFAAQTGMPCGQCHVNPAGGGALKAFGKKFKANGNKLKK